MGAGKRWTNKNIFEDFKALLQDSDAEEEKETVKNSLKKMSETTTYLVFIQKKFVMAENLQGISIIDTRGINRFSEEFGIRVKEQMDRSSSMSRIMRSCRKLTCRWTVICGTTKNFWTALSERLRRQLCLYGGPDKKHVSEDWRLSKWDRE